MTRRGKIARLPRKIRDEVNRRMDDGEAGTQLLEWLNGLPEVKTVLDAHFEGRPITDQNLSEWKAGGFRQWRMERAEEETVAQIRDLAKAGGNLKASIKGKLSDHAVMVMTARYAAMLHNWDGEVTPELKEKLQMMKSFSQELARMHQCNINSELTHIKWLS